MPMIGRTNPHARRLRREVTDAERRLWHYLRNRQLGGFKFRQQVTIGPFVADFACVDCRIVVEADGGQHGIAADSDRTAYLERLGWRVLRFWNNEILTNTDGVLRVILGACDAQQKEKPSPARLTASRPLPRAGEV